MSDLIDRQAAIREYQEVCKGIKCGECPFLIKVNTEKGSHLITDCKLEAFLHDLPSAQPEPCEDAVSRADVEGEIANILRGVFVEYQDIAKKTASKLPPVAPKRKTGKWTNENACEFCGFQPWYERDIHTLSYCPNCGAKMEE